MADTVAADRVREFLNDEYVRAALERHEDGLMRRMRRAPTPAERESLWLKLQAIDELKAALRAVVDDATVAVYDEERLKRRQETGL